MTDDLSAWLHQQFENQRFRGESLKTLAFALPPETGAYLTETGELLLADVDAKRRILDDHAVIQEPYGWAGKCERCVDGDEPWAKGGEHPCLTVRLLALPYADRPGYRDEWRP